MQQQQRATSEQIADQVTITRQGQVGERFSRAISQLGDKSIDVRLGGLYELEQLARPQTNAPERRLVIIEIVAAYIRQHARPPANTTKPGTEPPPQDVAAALTVLERRSIQDGDPQIDLRSTNFGGTNLAGADLHDADLILADLGTANLVLAKLSGADLRGTNL